MSEDAPLEVGGEGMNIGIVTFPIERSGTVPLRNLISLLRPLGDEVVLITGNHGAEGDLSEQGVEMHRISHNSGRGILGRVIRYMVTQAAIALLVLKNARKVDQWVFFFGGEGLLIPILAAKLGKNRVILSLAGAVPDELRSRGDTMRGPFELLLRANMALSDVIVLYTPNLVGKFGLDLGSDKVMIAHEHFIDFDLFRMIVPFHKRPVNVGFIGRMTPEKGILELVHAIPLILRERGDVRFIIIGDGELRGEVERTIEGYGLGDAVQMVGWAPHVDLPCHLNLLRLLVIPSSTEGLPNVMLEAMSCGTLVLASAVGSIPWVLSEGGNGLVMEDRGREALARDVLEALNRPDIEEVSDRGMRMVQRDFTFQRALEAWRIVLERHR